jgi:hypothetical protein
MSTVGTIGSLATGQLQQMRGADADRAAHEAASHVRAEQASQQAENAAGIGEMEQEGAASDRDADGRRPWEKQRRGARPADAASEPEPTPAVICSRDASGESGTQLDVSG